LTFYAAIRHFSIVIVETTRPSRILSPGRSDDVRFADPHGFDWRQIFVSLEYVIRSNVHGIMAQPSEIPASRSAVELRIAFKSMAAQRLARETALASFDTLWDDVNRAAMLQSDSNALNDYVALLKEMQAWYTEVLRGSAI
jgi:hypothetical protein